MIPGIPHHITQRGNYRQKVYHREEDRVIYLNLLRQYSRHYGVSIQAYSLMPNHFHLVATPQEARGLGRLFQQLDSAYARCIHLRFGKVGHLWQARYASVAMEEKHMWAAMVYVEQNPVKAGLVEQASEWRWSSAAAHLSGDDEGWLDLVEWRRQHAPETWKRVLELGLPDALDERRLSEATGSGWPVGSEEFLQHWEKHLGRRLRPGKPGRPKKPASSVGSSISKDDTLKAAG